MEKDLQTLEQQLANVKVFYDDAIKSNKPMEYLRNILNDIDRLTGEIIDLIEDKRHVN